MNGRKILFQRYLSISLIFSFVFTNLSMPQARAGDLILPFLPKPGTMIYLSPEFIPAHLTGMIIHPEDALKFDFIIHRGNQNLSEDKKQSEYKKLIKYFLASLAVPDEDQWVNLSPYEKNRMIKDDFGKTEMGRDLLGQDYLLKQITASLIYPKEGLGKNFWDSIYAQAFKKYGTSNVPLNTFNKVWIVPDSAEIYEKGNTVFLLSSHLKVMLEEDYLASQKGTDYNSAVRPILGQELVSVPNKAPQVNNHLPSELIRQIILPQLEKEINLGHNFANLRQAYSGMILAAWYKRALKNSLLGKIYANKIRLKGVDQPACRQAGTHCEANEQIYRQYLKAYKKGVFNFIKEDIDQQTNEIIPRKYFSGGVAPMQFDSIVHRDSDTQGLSASQAMLADGADDATVLLNEFKKLGTPQHQAFSHQASLRSIGEFLRDLPQVSRHQGAEISDFNQMSASFIDDDFWGMLKDGTFKNAPRSVVAYRWDKKVTFRRLQILIQVHESQAGMVISFLMPERIPHEIKNFDPHALVLMFKEISKWRAIHDAFIAPNLVQGFDIIDLTQGRETVDGAMTSLNKRKIAASLLGITTVGAMAYAHPVAVAGLTVAVSLGSRKVLKNRSQKRNILVQKNSTPKEMSLDEAKEYAFVHFFQSQNEIKAKLDTINDSGSFINFLIAHSQLRPNDESLRDFLANYIKSVARKMEREYSQDAAMAQKKELIKEDNLSETKQIIAPLAAGVALAVGTMGWDHMMGASLSQLKIDALWPLVIGGGDFLRLWIKSMPSRTRLNLLYGTFLAGLGNVIIRLPTIKNSFSTEELSIYTMGLIAIGLSEVLPLERMLDNLRDRLLNTKHRDLDNSNKAMTVSAIHVLDVKRVIKDLNGPQAEGFINKLEIILRRIMWDFRIRGIDDPEFLSIILRKTNDYFEERYGISNLLDEKSEGIIKNNNGQFLWMGVVIGDANRGTSNSSSGIFTPLTLRNKDVFLHAVVDHLALKFGINEFKSNLTIDLTDGGAERAVKDLKGWRRYIFTETYSKKVNVIKRYRMSPTEKPIDIKNVLSKELYETYGIQLEFDADTEGKLEASLKAGLGEFSDIVADYIERKYTDQLASADPAMKANYGGIDFNAAQLNLHIKRDGQGVPFPMSQQDMEHINIDGLVPNIIKIQPALSIPLLAELQTQKINT